MPKAGYRDPVVTGRIKRAKILRAKGWTWREIGAHLGVSKERALSLGLYEGQRPGGPKPRRAPKTQSPGECHAVV